MTLFAVLLFAIFAELTNSQLIGGLLGGGSGGSLIGGLLGGGSGGSNPLSGILGNLAPGTTLNLGQISQLAATLGGSGSGVTTAQIQNLAQMGGFQLPAGFDISQLPGFAPAPAPVPVAPPPAPVPPPQTAPVLPPPETNAPVTNAPPPPPVATQPPVPQPPAETPAPETDAPTAAPATQAPALPTQAPIAAPPPLGTPKPATNDGIEAPSNLQKGTTLGAAKVVQSEGLSTGATIGIVFVGILCCVLLGVLAFCIVTKYRNDEEAVASQVYGTQSMPSVYGQPAQQQQQWGGQQQQQPNWQQQPLNASTNSANWGLSANQGIALAPAEPVQQSYAVRERFATAHDLPDINGGLRATAPSAQYGNSPTLSGTGGQYVCQFCSKTYFYQNDLDQHMAIRHASGV